MVLLGTVALLALTMTGAGFGSPMQLIFLAIVVGFYYGPGIALFVLSGRVRKSGRGVTIAAMVIGILIAGLMFLSILGNAMNARSGGDIASIVFAVVIGLIATLLAVYCGQSLRHIQKHGDGTRGFEPIYNPMQATPDEPRS